MIWKKQGKLDKREEYRNLEPYLDGLKLNHFQCSLYNIYFLMRRYVTGFSLVFLHEYQMFQVSILMILSVSNFIYTVTAKPFKDKKTLYVEILNEFCILMCCYLMNLFLYTNAPDSFFVKIGWAFMGVAIFNILSNAVILIVD